MDKVLQGMASLGSECNSEAVSSEDHPKTRFRYSEAARRRYKKQLQREREAAKAQISPPKANSSPELSSGGARLWRLNAPGRGLTPLAPPKLARASKISDQGSYAHATKGLVRLALILEGFPDEKLRAAECGLIRKMIRGRILEWPSLGHSTIRHVANGHITNGHKTLHTVQLGTVQLRTVCLDYRSE